MASANPSELSRELLNELNNLSERPFNTNDFLMNNSSEIINLPNEPFNPTDFLRNQTNHPIYPSVPSGNQVDIFAKDNPQLFIKYYIDEYNKIKDKTQNKSEIISLLINATKYLKFYVSQKNFKSDMINKMKDDTFNKIIKQIKEFLNNPNWETFIKLYCDYPLLESVLMLKNIKDLTKYQDFVKLLQLYQKWLIIQWVIIDPKLLYTPSPMASQWKASGGMNKSKKYKSKKKYKSRKYKSRKLVKNQ